MKNIFEICTVMTNKYDLFLSTTLKGLAIIALILAITALIKMIKEY